MIYWVPVHLDLCWEMNVRQWWKNAFKSTESDSLIIFYFYHPRFRIIHFSSLHIPWLFFEADWHPLRVLWFLPSWFTDNWVVLCRRASKGVWLLWKYSSLWIQNHTYMKLKANCCNWWFTVINILSFTWKFPLFVYNSIVMTAKKTLIKEQFNPIELFLSHAFHSGVTFCSFGSMTSFRLENSQSPKLAAPILPGWFFSLWL